jgi:cellulose synthase/poly-beta-1,6-N-acetylglucosamine synthase-like glycosyltransferase
MTENETPMSLICSPSWDLISVSPGTKLSKLKSLAPLATNEVVCICDPDIDLVIDTAVDLVTSAVCGQEAGTPSIVFGTIQVQAGHGMLTNLLNFDKWLSHRILRPFLWNLGLGITLPGQFVVVPSLAINAIPDSLDTYLDDLCLGIVARECKFKVQRSSLVVGTEEGRSGWTGLLLQRIRWMKGFMSLLMGYWRRPKSVLLLVLHYTMYHAIPILLFLALGFLVLTSPMFGGLAFLLLASCGAYASGQSLPTVLAYMLVFPLLHVSASVLFWLPISSSSIRKR